MAKSSMVASTMQKIVMEHIQLLSDILLEEESQAQIKKKREKLGRILNYCSAGLQLQKSDEYKTTIDYIDKRRRGVFDISDNDKKTSVKKPKKSRNAIWECLACGDRWKVPIEKTPTVCREFSVRTDGTLTNKKGCGSTDIKKYKMEVTEEVQGGTSGGRAEILADIISGKYALVSGKLLTPIIDWDNMREEDNEVDFREEDRVIAVNPYHISYRIAEKFDKIEGKFFEIGEDKLPPAISTHVIKCICISWGQFHAEKTKKPEEFSKRYDSLKNDIYGLIERDMQAF